MDSLITKPTRWPHSPDFLMKLSLTLLTSLVLFALPAKASTLIWGSTPGDKLYTSYGAVLDDNFTFELGTFGTFTPTLSNADQWQANWRVFDRAVAPGTSGWNSGSGYFSSEATLTEDFTSNSFYASSEVTFTPGEQVYIWTYNTLSFGPGAEWALVTNDSSDENDDDNWVMPEPQCCGAGVVQFRIEDATSVPLGGVNDERGPGTFTNEPETYQLQTASIPEPGTSLLVSLLGFVFALRRRR
jgi:hypothetical protein